MPTRVVGMPLNVWGIYKEGMKFYLTIVVAIVAELFPLSHYCSWNVLEWLSKTKDTMTS